MNTPIHTKTANLWASQKTMQLPCPIEKSLLVNKSCLNESLRQLRYHALRRVMKTIQSESEKRFLEQVSIETEAVAWSTSYPLLVLPTLLEEKLEKALAYLKGQRSIHNRPRLFVRAA